MYVLRYNILDFFEKMDESEIDSQEIPSRNRPHPPEYKVNRIR